MEKLIIVRNFAQVPTSLTNNKNISFRAAGVYAYMQSKPDGWEFSSERIAEDGIEGRDAIRGALKELEDNGYLKRNKYSEGDGKFKFQYVLYPEPNFTEGGKPEPENPTSVNQATNINSKEKYLNNIHVEEFEKLWKLYPRPVNKKLMFSKFLKIENKEEVFKGLDLYLKYWREKQTELQYIPLLSTFLNQERYLTPPTPQNAPTPLHQTIQIPKTKAEAIAEFRQITVEEYIKDRERETGKKVILT